MNEWNKWMNPSRCYRCNGNRSRWRSSCFSIRTVPDRIPVGSPRSCSWTLAGGKAVWSWNCSAVPPRNRRRRKGCRTERIQCHWRTWYRRRPSSSLNRGQDHKVDPWSRWLPHRNSSRHTDPESTVWRRNRHSGALEQTKFNLIQNLKIDCFHEQGRDNLSIN